MIGVELKSLEVRGGGPAYIHMLQSRTHVGEFFFNFF